MTATGTLQRGNRIVAKLPQISLKAVYPSPKDGPNLNTCSDPDCGNYGVAPDFELLAMGRAQRRAAILEDAGRAAGRGAYHLDDPALDSLHRVSGIFEFLHAPVGWTDGRTLSCQHRRGNATCGSNALTLSNEHLEEERRRLASQNGLLDGPACGTHYLDAPDEFVLNGAHGKSKAKGRQQAGRPLGIRLIHRPCRGRKGARITVSSDHRRQKDRSDNVLILRQLVNEAGLCDLRRLLPPPKGGRAVGVSRLYGRLFWLEKVLLAHERAQLERWCRRLRREGAYRHTRVAHDDIVLGVNWETSTDPRVTSLNCSVSADIRTGFVFRLDVDFDPMVDPVELIERFYLGKGGATPALRARYVQKGGRSFTALLMAFQRPTGRLDEPALFASAERHLRLFHAKTTDKLDAVGAAPDPDLQRLLDEAQEKAGLIQLIADHWFGFDAGKREGRNAFTGAMTRDTYTKAAHLACLRDMVPDGKLTLVSEQEAAMARVVPHVFRDEILDDRFEWQVVGFDKKAKKPEKVRRHRKFDDALRAHRAANPAMTPWESLLAWTAANLVPATRVGRDGATTPFPGSNFGVRAFPALWLRSPIQAAQETNKVVGFPILSPRYRAAYKALRFDEAVPEGELRDAIARRVAHATLQPASTFMNVLRERLSFTKRAGGRSARDAGSYVNGACYNPRTLIAVLNIMRMWYNFFEVRPYVSPHNKHETTETAAPGRVSVRVPGSEERVELPQRRRRAPTMMTPAMRAGIHREDQGVPDPARVLYQPWLFHGTPLWEKFQTGSTLAATPCPDEGSLCEAHGAL